MTMTKFQQIVVIPASDGARPSLFGLDLSGDVWLYTLRLSGRRTTLADFDEYGARIAAGSPEYEMRWERLNTHGLD